MQFQSIVEEYQPESCEIDLEKLKESKVFCVKRYSDAIYFGEGLKQLKWQRQGKGVMRYQSGRVYEGQWEKD